MLIIAYIVLVFTVIQLLVALVNLLFKENLPNSDEVPKDLVSVLIPARNEANNIRNILDDLINQEFNNIEIIVFNDLSEDKTAEIVTEYSIRDKRIRLINSIGLPDGWLGKNFACHSLSDQAKGRYLLFIDADVRVSGNILNRAVSFSEKQGLDLISLFPKQIIKSFGERITVPNMNFILVSLLPLILVRKTKYRSLAAANGQFMLFKEDKYKVMRPHEMTKEDKVEDISIARIYKSAGMKVACLLGNEMTSCRMYNGFNEAVNGFSKNVIAFFGNSFFLASLFWLLTTFGFLPILIEFPTIIFIIYIIIYLMTKILISLVSRQNMFYNLLFILPLQFSLLIFIYKAFTNKTFKKFQWKGRNIN